MHACVRACMCVCMHACMRASVRVCGYTLISQILVLPVVVVVVVIVDYSICIIHSAYKRGLN